VDPQNQDYASFEGKLMQKQKNWSPSIQTFTVNGFVYRITSENSVGLESGGVYSGEIVIPPTVENAGKSYNVTSISGDAFFKCHNLVSVRVPVTVSAIEFNFGNAPESIHITIDEKNPYFTVIDDVVFNKNKTTLLACKGNKTQYVIPSSVTKIGSFAFYDCISLKSLVIPSSVTTIEGQAFMRCLGLTTLEIPNSVTSIGEYAFAHNPRLTSVTLPTSIKIVENGLFLECTGLKSFTIPSSVTTIEAGTFSSCSSLKSINIPSSVTSFGQFAFSDCTSLTSITLPPSLSTIVRQLFQECTGLTSISIPPSVTSIETLAFLECHSLTSVTIPENVSTIAENAFSNCIALKQIDVNSKNPYYTSLEGVLFNKDKSTLILYPSKKVVQYVVPNSVKTIESNAFSNCMELTSITLPNSVTTIGNAAFGACSNLKEILLPSSVQSIGNNAFSGCVKLTKVSIPASLTKIGGSAFRQCPIEEYRVDGKNPSFATVDGVFLNKDKTTLIACPVSKSGQYTIPSTVTKIDGNAFNGCSTLASITLPSSVTSIGIQAFNNCTSLKEVHCQIKNPFNIALVFSNMDRSAATLYVPKGSKELYASAREWNAFGTILEE